jgi:hypothetical protein
VWPHDRDGVVGGMSESHDKLTTDPPRPPGTPDVDEIVGDPVPTGEQIDRREEPENEDVTDDDPVAVEPPD